MIQVNVKDFEDQKKIDILWNQIVMGYARAKDLKFKITGVRARDLLKHCKNNLTSKALAILFTIFWSRDITPNNPDILMDKEPDMISEAFNMLHTITDDIIDFITNEMSSFINPIAILEAFLKGYVTNLWTFLSFSHNDFIKRPDLIKTLFDTMPLNNKFEIIEYLLKYEPTREIGFKWYNDIVEGYEKRSLDYCTYAEEFNIQIKIEYPEGKYKLIGSPRLAIDPSVNGKNIKLSAYKFVKKDERRKL